MPALTLFDKALRAAVAPTAHGITRTGLCKVSGKHLSEAPNDGDLTPHDLAQIDAEFAERRFNGSLQQEQDARALREQCAAQVRSEWTARS